MNSMSLRMVGRLVVSSSASLPAAIRCSQALLKPSGPAGMVKCASKRFSSSTMSTPQFQELEATAFAASALHHPKRFYKSVDVVAVPKADGDSPVLYEVHLDNRKLKTQAGKVLKLESNLLALAIAQEWDAQKTFIHRSRMLLTGLAFTSIDNPFYDTRESLMGKILEFLETDTLLYFTHEEESGSLARLQENKWKPVIELVNARYGLDLGASQCLVEPPRITEESRMALKEWLSKHSFAALNALNYGTEAIKSVLLVLAAVDHHLEIEEAVELGRLEQIYQAKIWGNVEWVHDLEHQQLCSRLSAAVLFVHLVSQNESKIQSLVNSADGCKRIKN